MATRLFGPVQPDIERRSQPFIGESTTEASGSGRVLQAPNSIDRDVELAWVERDVVRRRRLRMRESIARAEKSGELIVSLLARQIGSLLSSRYLRALFPLPGGVLVGSLPSASGGKGGKGGAQRFVKVKHVVIEPEGFFNAEGYLETERGRTLVVNSPRFRRA